MTGKFTEVNYQKIGTAFILLLLVILSFFLIKPILLAIITGLIFAFIFNPIYQKIYKWTKFKNFSVSIILVALFIIFVIPAWFLTPILINQSFKFYLSAQQVDFVTPLKKIFPNIFSTPDLSNEVGNVLQSFVTKTANSLTNEFSYIVLNLPIITIQAFVVFFVFYFSLRDQDELIEYIKSLLPFSKETEKKLFESSKGITTSVLYGQVVVGIIQGLITGVGFFIAGLPNALLFTLIGCFISMLPTLGPFLVWIPAVIFFLVQNNPSAAIIVLIFGAIASTIDNFVRPVIIARRTKLHSALVLVGMMGGFLLFGILGFILGPLIIAYLIIVLEIYRNKEIPGLIIEEKK